MTNSQLAALRERKSRVWHQAKALLDAADQRGGDLTAHERGAYDALSEDLDNLTATINRLESDDQQNRDVNDTLGRLGITGTRGTDTATAEAFRRAVLRRDPSPIDVHLDVRSGTRPGLESRALVTTNNVGTTFGNQIVRHMVDASAILSAGATLLTTESGEPYKVPKSTAMSTAAIVAEGDQIGTSDPTLGSASLGAYKYAFLTSISRELAEDAEFDIVDYLAAQSGQALGNAFGAHAIVGDGTGEPRGITIDTTLGVTGAAAAAGAFTADNLIDLYHSVAEPYARSASAAWVMKNASLGAVRKLKDDQGRYLFDVNAPAGSGASGTLLGRPVYADPNVAAVAADAKSVIFGDISRYWVRLVKGIRFDRSDDFAFDYDLVTFRATARLDGTLVDTTGAVKHYVGGAAA